MSMIPSRLHPELSAELGIVHMLHAVGMQDVSVRGLRKLALRFLKDVENRQCCQTPYVAWHT